MKKKEQKKELREELEAEIQSPEQQSPKTEGLGLDPILGAV